MASARTAPAKSFQETILRLQQFWAARGCLIMQPFDIEKGAGTYSPHTFLRALGPEQWKVAYVEPSRRPTDGRYGDNPNRLYRHHQYQVILKPSPADTQGLYLESMAALGIHPEEHDIRFVEDNWESPTLGAWGLGWEVWVDGMELTQFTYFQQCGGHECRPVAAELTYGLERISMYLQGVDNVYDLEYAPGVKYREVFHRDEYEYSKFTFEALDVPMYAAVYESNEKETQRLVEQDLVIPAYDHLLKAAHAFNSLDARGAISVTERQGYILRIRDLAKLCADKYLALREELGFPLLQPVAEEATRPSVAVPALPEAPAAKELFIELGTEELPAAEVATAEAALSKGLQERLTALGLPFGEVKTYCTPRRLVVSIQGLADRQEDRKIEKAGPPVKAAFKDGAPTKAAQGFAKGLGLSVDDLVRRDTDKGEYVYAIIEQLGQPTMALLPKLVEEALAAVPFKRSMRWGHGKTAFARPVQWLVALFGGQTIPARFAGVDAGDRSRGHRFLSPAEFSVTGLEQYLSEQQARRVMVDEHQRRETILTQARALAEQAGGRLVEDEELLDELAMLVELPVLHLNHFDPRFLDIPKEVLISEMQHHQRYLPIEDEGGALLNKFVVVANTEVEDVELTLGGYRRVLSARFEDGAFFFGEDKKQPLFERVERLKSVRFHRSLGSIYDKVERLVRLSFSVEGGIEGLGKVGAAPADVHALAAQPPPEGAERAAWALARAGFLAKADLTTLMVFEFTELQGVMGSHYARAGGEPADVADAIEQHYHPQGLDDALPEGDLGALVGIADRVDSVVGIFATGKGPKGSADPFGLRRATLGVLAILAARGWHLSLRALFEAAYDGLGDLAKKDKAEVVGEVEAFFRTRLKGLLTQEGVPTDVAEAVLSAGCDDVVEAKARAHALAALRVGQDFGAVAEIFKRVGNILRGKEAGATLDPAKLVEPAETQLAERLGAVSAAVKAAAGSRDYAAAFSQLGALQPAVDAFFTDVMVMAEDPELRAQRLALLAAVQGVFSPLADLSKLS